MLVLPYREISELRTHDHRAPELWATVTDAVRAIKQAYRPQGQRRHQPRSAAGGSVAQHLHVHAVPRWTGDANFMTALSTTRTLPEALPDTAAKLRAAWPR
ncbi:MAG: HIT domain-containing protein [Ilumatobacteraceae bacterium]